MIVTKNIAQGQGHLLKDLWETPDEIFGPLNERFGFTLDPCYTAETAKCSKFFTPLENGLIQPWEDELVFVNPPYSRGNIDLWVKKCFDERINALVVALLPVSTSSNWFHEYIYETGQKIEYIKGRVRFKGAPSTAPFSSMIVIFK